jgi:hypothetical protein
MTIYTMCVDAESGRYLAISASDPTIRVISHQSETHALGWLVEGNPGITIEKVVSIPTGSDD